MASQSKTTTDHETIRRWAEQRGAVPSTVRRTRGQKNIGVIRLDFPGFSGEGALEPITWDQFFEEFDKQGLALVFQDKTASGRTSSFNRFVKRETAAARAKGSRASGRKATTTRGGAKAKSATGTKRSAASASGRKASSAKRTTKRSGATTGTTRRAAAAKSTGAAKRTGASTRSKTSTTRRGGAIKAKGTSKRGATRTGAR